MHVRKWLLCLVLGVAADAAAQPPGQATLATAVGELSAFAGEPSTITFVWTAAPNATWYYLWVDDFNANIKKEWFTAADAGCDAGQTACRVTTTVPYPNARIKWWVQPWSPPASFGQWSAEHVVDIAGAFRSSQTTGNTFAGVDAGAAVGLGIRNTVLAPGGAAFIIGSENTGAGAGAFSTLAGASQNTAFGAAALRDAATASLNTALGSSALLNTTSTVSSAVGYNAGANNLSGSNVSVGANTMYLPNTQTILNVLLGDGSGSLNNGYSNIYINNRGVLNEGYTIRIGGSSHTAAYLAGVHGVTSASGIPVYVNGAGQLGTVTSSARFKTGIRGLVDEGRALYRLRPVSFTYRHDPARLAQFGLIAEDVRRLGPEWVLQGTDGAIQTVRYELLVPLLIKELQTAREALLQRATELSEIRMLIEASRARLARGEQR